MVVSDYINLMKTTLLFKFILLTSFFELQVYKEKFFYIDNFSLFPCFCVSMLFKSLIKIKVFILLIKSPTPVQFVAEVINICLVYCSLKKDAFVVCAGGKTHLSSLLLLQLVAEVINIYPVYCSQTKMLQQLVAEVIKPVIVYKQ